MGVVPSGSSVRECGPGASAPGLPWSQLLWAPGQVYGFKPLCARVKRRLFLSWVGWGGAVGGQRSRATGTSL